MRILGIFKKGGFWFQDTDAVKKYAVKNDGHKFEIVPYIPESAKARGFYHGAVIPLWAFLNGWDYRDSEILQFLHNEAKNEFNSEIAFLDGKKIRRGKSTKGVLADHIENVIMHLEEQYGIDRSKVLNPDHYKDFRDRVSLDGDYEDYIAYLVDLGYLKDETGGDLVNGKSGQGVQ